MKAPKSSLVAQRNSLIEQRDALERQIQSLTKDADAITEICNQVKQMAKDSGVSVQEIAYALAPDLSSINRTAEAPSQSKKRAVKIYHNPHNGEKIETKGGNHKILKQWKAQYTPSVVESWRSQ